MLAVALFLFVIGILVLIAGWKMMINHKKWNSFEQTTGNIISKKIGSKTLASGSGPNAKYRIDIQYNYSVNGITYDSDKFYSMELSGGEVAMSESEASKILNSLSNETIVYYNPNNPKEAFLIQNKLLPWVFLISGILLLLIGFILFQ